MVRKPREKKEARVAREADAWHIAMEEPDSAEQVARFEAWLHADPAHLATYREAEKFASLSEALPARHRPLIEAAKWQFGPAFALAAALVIVILASLWLGRDTSPAYAALINSSQSVRSIRLHDGSRIDLDVGTSLELAVGSSPHSVRLLNGRTRFSVDLPTDTPLEIATRAGSVWITDGLVDIAVSDAELRVWVVKGDARLSAGSLVDGNSKVIPAGTALLVQNGTITYTPLPIAQRLWPAARVAFKNTRLIDVVAIANRLAKPKILLADRAIERLQVTGVLDLRDTRALARKLAIALDLDLHERDGSVLLGPRQK